jgi:hypothetical protein
MARDTTLSFDDLKATQRSQLTAASELYAKHLQSLAKSALELGKTTDAKGFESEAEGVTADIVPKLQSEDGITLRAHEIRIIERGLAFFLKNLRAAKGTVRGLGKYKLAEDFEAEAVEVETTLLPRFAEQQSLV